MDGRLAVLLLLPGCFGYYGDTSDTADFGACVPAPGACPSSALVMGRAGAFDVQAVELAWRHDRACGLYIAQPVFLSRSADVVSYTLSVDAGSTYTAIGHLAVDGAPLIQVDADNGPTAFAEPPFNHEWEVASSVVLPISPATAPAGSCVAVVPIAEDDVGGTLRIASRRYAAGSTLDLHFVVLDGTDIEAWELDEVAYATRAAFAGAGVTIGAMESFSVDLGLQGYVDAEGPDIDELRATTTGGSGQAVNVFLVQDFFEADLYGIAGGIPGPVGVAGTGASGIVVSVDTHLNASFTALDTVEFGLTVAHEIGHQLGLFHTSEADGREHDVLDDTAECAPSRDADGDGALSAEECVGHGGENVMFWTSSSLTQDQWSPHQGFVLGNSPAARP